MRIAQIAPIIERIPPKKYGGTERVIHELTEELVKRGHEVTLFASGDSQTKAKLSSCTKRALKETKIKDLYGPNVMTMVNIGRAYDLQDQFDVIHDHNGYFSLPTANQSRTPVVMTYHGTITPEVKKAFQSLKNPHLVSISRSQFENIPGINIAGNVYHGLSTETYPFSERHDGYLLFVGRISMEKGVHHAIEVALRLDLPLIIAAKLDAVDLPYFNKYISPHLSGNIRWIGEVNEKERNRLMSRAMCFLHPVVFKEPFGLTLIESMACGCPVVAFDKGAIPEIILNGKTGFVVSDTKGMVRAVKKISSIKRKGCREYVLKNFNTKRMVDEYEKIYHEILKKSKN